MSLKDQAFNSFDPDMFQGGNSFDPDYMNGSDATAAVKIRQARPGRLLQVNLALVNNAATELTFELFNGFNSCADVKNLTYATGAYTYIPALSREGLGTVGIGTVGFNAAGELEISGANGNGRGVVSCREYPYKSFFESSKVQPFSVAYIRYTTSTDAQIDNEITHFQRTIGGGYKENTINPRAYFKPNQFQNRTIDIIAPFSIDGESGLKISVLAGENLRVSFYVQAWGKASV